MQLIEAKFLAGNGVDINYTAFVQSVDEEYTGQAMEKVAQETRYLGCVFVCKVINGHQLQSPLNDHLWATL